MKLRRIATMFLVAVMAIATISMPAYAASNSTATKAENAAKSLTRYAEYQGWTAEVGKTNVANGKATVVVKLHNSKHIFAPIKVIAKSGKKATYYFKGKKYGLKGWKVSLKKYAISSDRKALMKSKVDAKVTSLEKYAKNRGWAVKKSTLKTSSSKAYRVLTFTNEKYKWKATVINTRGNGKLTMSYKRDGSKSSLKGIKNWLNKYALSYGTGTIDPPIEQPTPPAPTTDIDTADYGGLNADVDTSFTGEPVPNN